MVGYFMRSSFQKWMTLTMYLYSSVEHPYNKRMWYCLFCLWVFILGILIGVLIVLNYFEKKEEKVLAIMEQMMEEEKELKNNKNSQN